MARTIDGFLRLQDIELDRQRVFVRADLDCPADERQALGDDAKLLAAIPTLKHLLESEAQVVVAGHRRKRHGQLPSMEACAARLAELLEVEIALPEESVGLLARKLVNEIRPGQLVMLENLAAEQAEQAGDPNFARQLLEGVELYVGDCLAGPHDYASIAQMPRMIGTRAIGLRMDAELFAANRLTHLGWNGFAAIVGGRFTERAPLLDHLRRPGVVLCLAGELARTLERSRTKNRGRTDAETRELGQARSWLQQAERSGVELHFPQDVLVRGEAGLEARDFRKLRDEEVIVDLGPSSGASFGKRLNRSSVGLVAGAFGAEAGDEARACVQTAARGTGFVVALHEPELPVERLLDETARQRIGFVSTAGDAFVELFMQRKLPGLEALKRAGR